MGMVVVMITLNHTSSPPNEHLTINLNTYLYSSL